MLTLILALLIGIVAGLRAMTAPAAVSWAATLGWLNLDGSWLAFLGYRYTPYILTLLPLPRRMPKIASISHHGNRRGPRSSSRRNTRGLNWRCSWRTW